MQRKRRGAFTLAELLIALAVLGVIATFTIPKVLTSQQNQKWNSIAREAMATVSQAYQLYQQNNIPTANTSTADLIPYLSYAYQDMSSVIEIMGVDQLHAALAVLTVFVSITGPFWSGLPTVSTEPPG